MRFPSAVPRLSDGVVTLRPATLDDVPDIVEQCNDPESIAWTKVPVPYGDQDAIDWVSVAIPKGWHANTDLCFAIEYDGRFAGSTALRPDADDNAEIAFGLAAWARGHGVASRAVRLLLRWGFSERGYAVVHWRANVGNFASRRVAWSTGFAFGPTIPGLMRQRGERRDGWTGWVGAGDPLSPHTPWFDVPVLEANGLRLRPWRESDGPRLVEASNDGLLRRFIPESPLPREIDDVGSYLTAVHLGAADGQRIAWCIADRDTD
jgi:RimJ/RimL family protein N-acetyltransferase